VDEQLVNLRIIVINEGLLEILSGFRGEIDLKKKNIKRKNVNKLVTPF
jgi:hypothetical protein